MISTLNMLHLVYFGCTFVTIVFRTIPKFRKLFEAVRSCKKLSYLSVIIMNFEAYVAIVVLYRFTG